MCTWLGMEMLRMEYYEKRNRQYYQRNFSLSDLIECLEVLKLHAVSQCTYINHDIHIRGKRECLARSPDLSDSNHQFYDIDIS